LIEKRIRNKVPWKWTARLSAGFGSSGDLILQKSILVKPIKIKFSAVQDIAELKKWFYFRQIFRPNNAICCKRFDISDQVLQYWTELKKRAVNKKQVAAEEAKQNREDEIQDNPLLSERQKLDEKKSHKRFNAGRKLIQEKKKADTGRDDKMISDREDKKMARFLPLLKRRWKKRNTGTARAVNSIADTAKQEQLDARAKILEDQKKVIVRKALEERIK
jgi:hypothetical protein